jgi:hypothetical protein
MVKHDEHTPAGRHFPGYLLAHVLGVKGAQAVLEVKARVAGSRSEQ